MVLALKSGPQIATETGNPAGLLFRRIWYSVAKSGVLGITEYRQGRPLSDAQIVIKIEVKTQEYRKKKDFIHSQYFITKQTITPQHESHRL